jgi:hypothetical protein
VWSSPDIQLLPFGRKEKIAAVLFVVILTASACYRAHPWYEHRSDATSYIASARAILDGEGYSYLGIPLVLRPPGFSLMLTPILATLGTDFYALNLFVCLFGVAAVLLLYLYLRPRVGWVAAMLTGLTIWLLPGYRRLCTQILSDIPGLALLLGCLLVDRWVRVAPSWRRELMLGISIGLSAYVRTTLLLLVPAVWFSRLALRGREAPGESWRTLSVRLAAVAITAVIVQLPWQVRNQVNRPPPPIDQAGYYDYATAMFRTESYDPSSPFVGMGRILDRVPLRGLQIIASVGSGLETMDFISRHAAVGAGLLVLAFVLVLGHRRGAGEFFVLLSTLSLLIYFSYARRLALPLLVLGLGAGVEAFQLAVGLLAQRRTRAVLSWVALTGLAFIAFEPRTDLEALEQQTQRYTDFANSVEEATSPSDRLAMYSGAQHQVFMKRRIYNLRWAAIRFNGFEGIEKTIDKYNIDTVVIGPGNPPGGYRKYFLSRYKDVRRVGEGYLIRVRP